MKSHVRFALFVILLLAWSVSLPLAAQDSQGLKPGLGMSTGVWPNLIYSETNRNSHVLRNLEVGALVNVLQVDGQWAQIEYDNVVGWVWYARSNGTFLINVSRPNPGMRGYHLMTYDVESDRVILFGGAVATPPNTLRNDTWSYEVSTNTWTKMAPAQSPPLGEGPLAYDVQSDRAIWFYGASEDFSTMKASETWAYDLNTDTWINKEPVNSPPPLLGTRMVYDAESDRMILFSGLAQGSVGRKLVFLNETWAYDYNTNTWTKMKPAVSPPGRNFHAMAYDAQADRVIMFGASVAADNPDGAKTVNDTWAYDYNTDTWTALEPIEAPLPHDYSAMVYSNQLKQVILFGGVNEFTGEVFNDTWTYDFAANTWRELHPALSPSARGWHAMVYSPSADQIILFGGGVDRNHYTFETWGYDPKANTWANAGF